MHIYMQVRNAAILITVFGFLWPGLAAAQDAFLTAVEEASAHNWEKAYSAARRVDDPAALTVVNWMRLRAGVDSYKSYARFLENHGDWPGLKLLRKVGEATLAEGVSPAEVVNYFRLQPPQTGNGALALAAALEALGRPNRAKRLMVDSWQSLPFPVQATNQALRRYGNLLGPLDSRRLDQLLWEGRLNEARRFLIHASPARRQLAETRIALQQRRNGVDALIANLPSSMRNNAGLLHDRVSWRRSRGMDNRAANLLIEVSSDPDRLGRPARWASTRLSLGYSLINAGSHQLAYQVVSNHHLSLNGSLDSLDWLSDTHVERQQRTLRRDYLDLEWLAGFIALRKLKEPKLAIFHFQNFMNEIVSPTYDDTNNSHISRGRAGYWLGRALSAAGETERSQLAYEFGARHQTSFYGQLAAESIASATQNALVGSMARPKNNRSKLRNDSVVRAAFLYTSIKYHSYSAWFLAHRAETLDRSGIVELADLARQRGAEFEALKIAKQGAVQGEPIVDLLFPVTDIAYLDLPLANELAIAVARQETEFRDNARSPQGALGLMQVLPSTARPIARSLGKSGPIERILIDPSSNVTIGATYLNENVERFDGSIPLAVAAYNAGPGRVLQWLKSLGDPRKSRYAMIDWIEMIPFSETRNYVMRVLEASVVYRMRLHKRTTPINLSRLLAS